VVASPDYLSRRGTPKTVEDLQDHACLRLRRSSGGASPWRFATNSGPLEVLTKGPLIAGDFLTLLDAAAEGVGLAQVPEPVAAGAVNAGALRAVLLGYALQVPGVFLYYPDRRQVMPKLRVFIDHLKERLGAPPSLGDPPGESGAAKAAPRAASASRDDGSSSASTRRRTGPLNATKRAEQA
jgi:DNA-binding transcriptional LysR family regulator